MHKNIVLYSTGCPRCNELKLLLSKKNIAHTEVNSIDDMLALGITKVPMLGVNNQLLDFSAAQKWIMKNSKGGFNEKQ